MVALGKIFFLFTFFAFLVQSLYFFGDKADELLAVPMVLAFGGLAAFLLGRNLADEDADFQVNIFFWAFSLRLWMGIIFYGWDLTELFGDEDASGYMSGWTFAQNWYENGFDGFVSDIWLVFFEEQNVGQGLLWGIPMFIAGGPSRMIVSVVNAFAGSMLVIVIFRIGRRVFDSATGKIAAIMVTFWASMILLSAGTSKEILVITFEWTVLYLMIRHPKAIAVKDGLLAIPLLIGIFIMRFYAVYMVVAAFVFRALTMSGRHLVRNVVFGGLVLGSVLVVMYAGGAINRDFARLERQQRVVETWRENVAMTTGSGVEIYSEYESTTVAIPVATVYFFFAPFPWEVFSGTARNGFGAVENIFIILILIVGFPALKVFFKDKFIDMAPIFVFCALYAGLHIWGLSNVGLAWRHKQTIMPMLFLLAALGLTYRKIGWAIIRGRLSGRREPLTVVRST